MSQSCGTEITEVVFETDRSPMLPASFAQSVSFDPDCSCEFQASFGEERWGSSNHGLSPKPSSIQSESTSRHTQKSSSPVVPRRKASLDAASFPDYMFEPDSACPVVPQRKASLDVLSLPDLYFEANASCPSGPKRKDSLDYMVDANTSGDAGMEEQADETFAVAA